MVLRQPLLNVADGAFERNVEAERRVFVMRTLDHQRHFVGVHRYDRSREDGQAEKLLSWQSRPGPDRKKNFTVQLFSSRVEVAPDLIAEFKFKFKFTVCTENEY